MNPSAKAVVYRILAVVGIAAPYIDFANSHRRVPLAAAVISFAGLVLILMFIERKKALLPLAEEEKGRKGATMALCIFCGSLVIHAVILRFL